LKTPLPLSQTFCAPKPKTTNESLPICHCIFKSIATKVETIKADYEDEQKTQKSRFNAFDTLTRHHLEELHSNFIAYLLNVDEKHDFGDAFLRLFVEIVNENLDFDDKINGFDYKEAQIYKEYSTQYGRLDIFITTKNFNIIIENKIYANEQDEQIPRYVAFAKSQHKRRYIVLYLTPEGYDSATGAVGTYHAISYRNDILKWLERCLLHTPNYPIAHAGIYFYKKTLEQKILHITDNQILMDIKTLFKDNDDAKEILKHWGEIQPAVEAYGAELKLEFFKRVYEELQKDNELFLYKRTAGLGKRNLIRDISDILTEEKKQVKGFEFKDIDYFVVEHDYNNIYFGIAGFDVNKDKEDIIKRMNYQSDFSNGYWQTLRYFKPHKISFFSLQIHYLATNMDKLVNDFVTEVEKFLTAWRETVEELNKKQ
jgi:hypothetical protein